MRAATLPRVLTWVLVTVFPITLYASETGGNRPSVSVDREGSAVIVSWSGLSGSLVKVEICRGDQVLADLSGWVENTGSFRFVPTRVTSTNPDDPLRFRISSELEAPVWSDDVIIEAPVQVSLIPHSASLGIQAEWSGGENPVKVELHREGVPIRDLSGWIDNTGAWSGELPDDLDPLGDYCVVVSGTRSLVGGSGLFSIDWAHHVTGAISLIPGERLDIRFDPPGHSRVYRFNGRQLMAYALQIQGMGDLQVEVLDTDMNSLHRFTQPSGERGAWWDCWENGTYHLALSAPDGDSGDNWTITLEEYPGWENATRLEHKKRLRGTLAHNGDVNYYYFERGERPREFTVETVGSPSLRLFWVNTSEAKPEAMIMGSELMIHENFPGAEIEPGGYSYYGVAGDRGEYTVEMRATGKGSKTALILIGVGLGLVIITAATISSYGGCGSDIDCGLDDWGCLSNLGSGSGCLGSSSD